MRQNGSPSYRHLHKPYWFIMGPFGKDYENQDQKYWLKQAKYCILYFHIPLWYLILETKIILLVKINLIYNPRELGLFTENNIMKAKTNQFQACEKLF